MSRLRIASITATAAATAFSGMDIAGIWDSRITDAVHDAATGCIAAAAALWLALFLVRYFDQALRHVSAEYRRKESVIVKLADRIERPTQPFPRIP